MPAPLSMDLRKRVIAAHKEGWQGTEIAHRYAVSVNTVYRWIRRFKKERHARPRKGYQKGYGNKLSLRKIAAIVRVYPDMTQAQIAKKHGNIGETTVNRALKKLRLTNKKKVFPAQTRI